MSPLARPVALFAAFTFLLAACTPREEAPPAAAARPAASPFAAPTGLTATLADGGKHIDLAWTNNSTEAGGAFLEFNMNPGEEYTILEIVPADARSMRHPDVAPETRFGYRVRPFYGRASSEVEITTGKAKSPPPAEEEGPLGPADADTSKKPSVRSLETMDAARPVELSAALASPTTVDLRWQDRAGDEEGYLVEMAADVAPAYRVVALLPPNTTSFRKIRLPENMRLRFRARAYFLGEPSNEATATTPREGGTPKP